MFFKFLFLATKVLLLIFHVIFPLMESRCTLKILKNNLRFLKYCYRETYKHRLAFTCLVLANSWSKLM